MGALLAPSSLELIASVRSFFWVNCTEEAPKHLAEAASTTCVLIRNFIGANGNQGSGSLPHSRIGLSKEGIHKPQSRGAWSLGLTFSKLESEGGSQAELIVDLEFTLCLYFGEWKHLLSLDLRGILGFPKGVCVCVCVR